MRYAERIPSHEHVIVQEYIEKPLLVDGFKCDLRIYVLVTSCSPLRVFLFNDGLLRMSTEPYISPSESNMVRCSDFGLYFQMNEWMNEWMIEWKTIYIERLKAYKCTLNLPRLAEN